MKTIHVTWLIVFIFGHFAGTFLHDPKVDAGQQKSNPMDGLR